MGFGRELLVAIRVSRVDADFSPSSSGQIRKDVLIFVPRILKRFDIPSLT